MGSTLQTLLGQFIEGHFFTNGGDLFRLRYDAQLVRIAIVNINNRIRYNENTLLILAEHVSHAGWNAQTIRLGNDIVQNSQELSNKISQAQIELETLNACINHSN